jgi:hypothetical protein
MEFVTREISYYGIFEVIYLRRNFDATEQLSDALVSAYTKILQYLSGAKRYWEQHSLGTSLQFWRFTSSNIACLEKFIKTALSLDEDLGSIATGIKDDREDIERLRGMIDGQRA